MGKFFLLCLLIWAVVHYWKVWRAVWRLATEVFKKDTTDRPLGWRLKMRLNHVRMQLEIHHSTWAFIILSGRLVICNTIGHRWSEWTSIKYGNYGRDRTCKCCWMRHSIDENSKIHYTETHDKRTGWQRVNNPDAVFNRVYLRARGANEQSSTSQ